MQGQIILQSRSDIVLPEDEPWAAHMRMIYENQESLNKEIWK